MHFAGTDSMRQLATTLLIILTLAATSTSQAAVQVGSVSLAGAMAITQGEPATFQGGCMSLEQAVSRVRRQYPGGKIVSAETRGKSHVIKVLTAEGTVRTVRMPAC